MIALRVIGALASTVFVWWAIVWVFALPHYILPDPLMVAQAFAENIGEIGSNALVTLAEIALGLLIGVATGWLSALLLIQSKVARAWLLPMLVASQAIPVFALAPLLVIWLGYGLASKIVMAALIIYFPVAIATFDGLKRADPGLLDLARVMAGSGRKAEFSILRHVRIPAALPAAASGLRLAVAVAPIGAVIGEWVGAGAGLGYLMMWANARMKVPLMFAALIALAVLAVALYVLADFLLRRALPWARETHAKETTP